jgi:hypothetical protein
MEMVRFQVLTAASMKMTLFWDVAPCSLVEIDRHFGGTYCLHHQEVGSHALSYDTTVAQLLFHVTLCDLQFKATEVLRSNHTFQFYETDFMELVSS